MLETVNPATGEVLATFPVHGRREVEAAVANAREAASWWAGLGWSGRRIRLLAWKSYLVRYMGRLAQLMHEETGKPLDDAKLEIILAVLHIDWAARHARRVLRPRRVRSGLAAINQASTLEYLPLGVVGVIGPWNYPVFTPVGSIAYALAAGNAVVFKPSELTPATGAWLVRSFEEALGVFGSSQPVLQLVTGPGSTGEALARSGVGKIAFTGSTATARKVMSAAADTLTPVLAECGGKDALLVGADADLDAAADAAAWGAMSNAGQTCVGIERVYVADAVYHSFLERLIQRVSGLRPGSDPEASYGPMTLPSQTEVVAKHVADALARGGRPVVGGADSVDAPYVRPVILTDVPENSAAVQDETFGPTVTVKSVVNMAEAVSFANAGRYGLGSAVFARDRRAGHGRGPVTAHRDDVGELGDRLRHRARAAVRGGRGIGVRADPRRGRAARVQPVQGHHPAADAAADHPDLVRADRPGHAAAYNLGDFAARAAVPAAGFAADALRARC